MGDGVMSTILSRISALIPDAVQERVAGLDPRARTVLITLASGASVLVVLECLHPVLHLMLLRYLMPSLHRVFDKATLEKAMDRLHEERGDLAVLEVGCGSGQNFDIFPPGSRLTLVEPFQRVHADVRRHFEAEREARRLRLDALLAAKGEELSDALPDASFDVVLMTCVLCSVDDVDFVAEESHRLLKPGGQLLCVEHVKGSNIFQLIFQVLFFPIFKTSFHCHLLRDPLSKIKKKGFKSTRSVPISTGMSNLLIPMIYIAAEK